MLNVPAAMRSSHAKTTLIVLLVGALAIGNWTTSPRSVVLHNVLHHLNILPFMLAGLLFGWNGAIKTIILAAVLQAPSIYRHWFTAPLDAQDQIVELSCFGAAGIIAGLLADRERTQRQRVEATKAELEKVYEELQHNIDRLKKTERLTAAGQLSASLAHEIRNPLASISGAAGILSRGQASTEKRSECLEILTKESQRLNKLLTNFLEFARPRMPRLQLSEPAGIIRSVTALAQHEASIRGVSLDLQELQSLPEVPCDPEQIQQLLLNLILNAIQATPKEGHVLIRSSLKNGRLRIEVCDGGTGIPPGAKEHIFEPFFTTKENGTGLGLAIAANIAVQHRGILTCHSEQGCGALFRLELPVSNIDSRDLKALFT